MKRLIKIFKKDSNEELFFKEMTKCRSPKASRFAKIIIIK